MLSRRQWLTNSLLAASGAALGSRSQIIEAVQRSSFPIDENELRLMWNENPYGPSKSALEAATQSLFEINRYPDEVQSTLVTRLAEKHNVGEDQIMLTCGSTEILSLMGQYAGLMKGEIVAPWPTFPTLLHFGEVSGARITKVDLAEGDVVDLDAILEKITDETKLVFICNPNNPTSTEVDPEKLREFCMAVPALVKICVDEAYIEYSRARHISQHGSTAGQALKPGDMSHVFQSIWPGRNARWLCYFASRQY